MGAIDLNADLGETVDGVATADDEAMFAVISSASIACGGHAGDAASMHDAVERAARTGVAVGAHPSYPDRAHFGRVALHMDASELRASVGEQLEALVTVGADIRYVKPHGALYHVAGADPEVAEPVVQAVAALSEVLGRPVPILAAGEALVEATAAIGLPFFREAFLDRGYRRDGSLIPRGLPGDLRSDPDAAAERAVRLVTAGEVVAEDGATVAVSAGSLCVHGDTSDAVRIARTVRAALDAAAIEVRAPWT